MVSCSSRWTAYSANGIACGGYLGEPIELRLVDGQWIEDGQSADDLAQSQAPYTRVLAAPIDAVCTTNMLWAHPEGRGPSVHFTPGASVSDDERAHAVAALRALPSYAGIQTEYESFTSDPESYTEDPFPAAWDAYDGGTTNVWRIEDRGRELMLVSAQVGYGCGMFIGNLWAVFERNSEGELVLVAEKSEGTPQVLIDIEGDGTLERLTWDGIYSGDQAREIQRDPWMCPC